MGLIDAATGLRLGSGLSFMRGLGQGGLSLGTGSLAELFFALWGTSAGGAVWSFEDDSCFIYDPSTSANNYNGSARAYFLSRGTYSGVPKWTLQSNGLYAQNASGTLPYAWSTSGAALGYVAEEARTNSIRNNTMQGAVAGTPGTAPTNWLVGVNGNGLSIQNVGSGTQNGVDYVDYRFFGTTTGTQGITVFFETSTGVTAATGQAWTESAFLSVVSGSTANLSLFRLAVDENTAAGAFLANQVGTNILGSLTGSLVRYAFAFTTANASTARIRPYIVIETQGVSRAVDITLRIGWPQLEQGAFATSPIVTTSAAVTRAADRLTVATSVLPFNASAGTLYTDMAAISSAVGVNGGIDLFATGNDKVSLRYAAGIVQSGGVQQASMATGGVGVAKRNIAYQANNFAATGGGTLSTDSVGSVPTGITALNFVVDGFVFFPNATLRTTAYFPRRIANADLQTMTAA